MTTGIQSKGADIDTIFDPLVSGQTPAAATGIHSNSADLNTLFAPLALGSAATATGIESAGADLNTIFAAKGSVSYATPDNGNVYHANYIVPSGQSGDAGISMTISSLNPLQYSIGPTGNNTGPALTAYDVPAGMQYVKATLSLTSGTAVPTVSQTTNWLEMTALGVIAEILSATYGDSSGTNEGAYLCTLEFSADGVNSAYSGTSTWNWLVDGSV